MNPTTVARLAWGMFAACLMLNVLALAMGPVRGAPTWGYPLVLSFLVTPAVGAVVALRQPNNAIGWLLLASGLGFGVAGAGSEYAALSEIESLPVGAAAGWLANVVFFGIVVIGAVLVPLLFPNGRLLTARWRPALLLAAAALLFGTTGSAVLPGDLDLEGVQADNPFGIEGAEWVLDVGYALILFSILVAGLSLALRFRRSRGDERQQIKWAVFTAALMPLVLSVGAVVEAFGQPIAAFEIVFYFLLLFGLPASIGIAILRYRLYDIDRIINRTLTYGVLTALLAGVYFGLVVALQALLRPLNGGSDLALVATTLAVAALFLPARRRVQAAVDRRFNRRVYDATQTIDVFSARLREQIDLDTLRYEVLAVVDESMQPAGASLWLRDRPEAAR